MIYLKIDLEYNFISKFEQQTFKTNILEDRSKKERLETR